MLRMIGFEFKKMYANSVVTGSLAVLLLVCVLILQAYCFNSPAASVITRTVHNYPAEKRSHLISGLPKNIPGISLMIRLQKWFRIFQQIIPENMPKWQKAALSAHGSLQATYPLPCLSRRQIMMKLRRTPLRMERPSCH